MCPPKPKRNWAGCSVLQAIEFPGETVDEPETLFKPTPEQVERFKRDMEAVKEAERITPEDLQIWVERKRLEQ